MVPPGVALAVVAPTRVTPAISDMALARVVEGVSRLNPVAILDGDPLILATVKRIFLEEFLSFFKSEKATSFRSSVLCEVVVVQIWTRFRIPDLTSLKLLVAHLKELQLTELGAASVPVVALNFEQELVGSKTLGSLVALPLVPLPAPAPLCIVVVHFVNAVLALVIIVDCDEFPRLWIASGAIVC